MSGWRLEEMGGDKDGRGREVRVVRGERDKKVKGFRVGLREKVGGREIVSRLPLRESIIKPAIHRLLVCRTEGC